MQYYAITKYGTTKAAPFSLVRFNQGVFEEYRNGAWTETDQYDGILIGEFSDYALVTADEAEELQKMMQ